MEEQEQDQPFKVDSKRLCIFCLRPQTVSSIQSRLSMKLLLRYLDINVYNLCNFSSNFLQSMDACQQDADVEVSLCGFCDHNIGKFSALYQEMEVIRLRMDESLQKVHDAVAKSSNDQVCMAEYRKRMSSRNMMDMFNANLAENLRSETLQKCSQKLKSKMLPKVGMLKSVEPQLLLKSTSKPRKPPGPKSKTQQQPESSKLEQPLFSMTTRKRPRSPLPSSVSPATKQGLIQGQSNSSTVNNYLLQRPSRHRRDSPFKQNNAEKANEQLTEELVVKLEPNISIVEQENVPEAHKDPLSTDETQSLGNHFLAGAQNQDAATVASTSTSIAPDTSQENQSVFTCQTCGKAFDKISRLYGHLAAHRSENNSNGGRIRLGKKKLRKVGGGKRFKCSFCSCQRFFYAFSKYKLHMKTHVSESKMVVEPNKKPVAKVAVVNGANNTKTSTYPCAHCDKVFGTWNIRNTHIRVKHSIVAIGKYLPPGTSEEELNLATTEAYDKHIKKYDDPMKKPYVCFYCSTHFPHPSHLKLHILYKHIDVLVDIVLRNKAISTGADNPNFQFDGLGNVGMDVQIEEDSLLYDEVSQDEDAFRGGTNVINIDDEEDQEQEICISEPFTLSNGNGSMLEEQVQVTGNKED